MTGLEKILEQIAADGKQSCDKIMAEANAQCQQILANANEAAKEQSAKLAESNTLACNDIIARANSGAELEQNRTILVAKQQVISNMLENSKAALKNLPDEEYFGLLEIMAVKNALNKDGEIAFGEKDLKRLPKNFVKDISKKLNVSLTLCKTPADIDSGFVLIYGGIEENCSFDAVFASENERLCDMASKLLFEK